MRKKKKIIPQKSAKSNAKPVARAAAKVEWQTGEYSRHVTFNFAIPYQLLLLCKLMDITPRQLLTDFMDNLSYGTWKREGKETARYKLLEYFLEQGYGQHIYTNNDVLTMFKEIDAIGLLYPKSASAEMMDQHLLWREQYHEYWFNKWFTKFNRNV